jgi:calcium binding protein 39
MPFLGGLMKDKPKTAQEVVAKTVAAFELLDTAVKDKQIEKALEDVQRYLNYMKQWMFGDESHEATKDSAIAMATEACKTNLLSLMVQHMAQLEFESRKDAAQIFGAIVRIKDADDKPFGSMHVQQQPDILLNLIDG